MTLLRSTALAAALLSGQGPIVEKRPAPEYSARRLGGTEAVSLASLRGRVVLLNTWATWCAPCVRELPAFEALYRDRGPEGLEVVGVNIDEGGADEPVTRYLEGRAISFPIWRDPDNRFAKRFRVLGVPETFLVSRHGELVHHWRGAMDPQAPENLAVIQVALAAPCPERGPEAPGEGLPSDGQPSARRGRRLAEQRGCLTCHSTDGSKGQGPSLKAGKEIVMDDGRTIVRDREYLTRAITDPDREIVTGYARGVMAGAMPGRPLTGPEVEALVLYILSLSGIPSEPPAPH